MDTKQAIAQLVPTHLVLTPMKVMITTTNQNSISRQLRMAYALRLFHFLNLSMCVVMIWYDSTTSDLTPCEYQLALVWCALSRPRCILTMMMGSITDRLGGVSMVFTRTPVRAMTTMINMNWQMWIRVFK